MTPDEAADDSKQLTISESALVLKIVVVLRCPAVQIFGESSGNDLR
ncbi:MAG TPA: hypothetical protein VGF24_29355 [Vicinamibacterales bacterium]|jgi:hypothetical protein